MAHHKSALKRIRQTQKRRLYNRLNKKTMREAIRSVRESKNYEEGMERFKKVTSILDRISAKGILHKNAASNRKGALSKFVKSLKETSKS